MKNYIILLFTVLLSMHAYAEEVNITVHTPILVNGIPDVESETLTINKAKLSSTSQIGALNSLKNGLYEMEIFVGHNITPKYDSVDITPGQSPIVPEYSIEVGDDYTVTIVLSGDEDENGDAVKLFATDSFPFDMLAGGLVTPTLSLYMTNKDITVHLPDMTPLEDVTVIMSNGRAEEATLDDNGTFTTNYAPGEKPIAIIASDGRTVGNLNSTDSFGSKRNEILNLDFNPGDLALDIGFFKESTLFESGGLLIDDYTANGVMYRTPELPVVTGTYTLHLTVDGSTFEYASIVTINGSETHSTAGASTPYDINENDAVTIQVDLTTLDAEILSGNSKEIRIYLTPTGGNA
jgi:hypothetical protein